MLILIISLITIAVLIAWIIFSNSLLQYAVNSESGFLVGLLVSLSPATLTAAIKYAFIKDDALFKPESAVLSVLSSYKGQLQKQDFLTTEFLNSLNTESKFKSFLCCFDNEDVCKEISLILTQDSCTVNMELQTEKLIWVAERETEMNYASDTESINLQNNKIMHLLPAHPNLALDLEDRNGQAAVNGHHNIT